MQRELQMLLEFHEKFHANPGYTPRNIDLKRAELRHKIILDEVDEYLEWAQKNDTENIAKELCDILYGVYGTIIEHGLQDVIEDCFVEVHRSNMSKDYAPGKLIKWERYSPADLSKFIS